MLKKVDWARSGGFLLSAAFFLFIFVFFALERFYLEKSNISYTVILGKNLFAESSQNLHKPDGAGNADDKEQSVRWEYKKTLFMFQDSGETILTETWMDPETLEYRTDEIVTSGGGKVEKNFTFFTKDGASHHMNIFRDENGKPVSGEEFYYPQETADNNADDLRKYETFAGYKAMYQDEAFWKDRGTVTAGGKTLKKLLCGNEKKGNFTYVYMDETTGFPVKQESFEKGRLVSTMNYEFNYVDRDETLFDAGSEGVTYKLRDIGKSAQQLKETKEKLREGYWVKKSIQPVR